MLTEEAFISLARSRYAELSALSQVDNFFDYEKNFDELWVSLGREVLEGSLGTVPTNYRKKKNITRVMGQ
jgi:hypothetical protein